MHAELVREGYCMIFDNYVFNEDSVYDILNATVDDSKLQEVAESKMEFKDSHSIILYTSLNENNTKALQAGTYKDRIKAFEYAEMAMGVDQSEYIIKISYDTQGLYDTMHPLAYKEIQDLIKSTKGIKKAEIEDMEILRLLNQKHPNITGFRVHSLNANDKVSSKTHIFFGNSTVAYFIKPQYVKVEAIESKKLK